MTVTMISDVGRRSRSLDIQDAHPQSSQRRPDQKGLPVHLIFDWAKERSIRNEYEAVSADEIAGLGDVEVDAIDGPPTITDYKSEARRWVVQLLPVTGLTWDCCVSICSLIAHAAEDIALHS